MHRLYLVCFFLICHLGHAFVYLNTARIAYYNERDYPRAKKACLEGIKAGKEHYELYAILGGSEIGLGNWKNGADALIRALAIDSSKTLDWMHQRGGEQYYFQAFFFSAREFFDEEHYEEVLKNLRYAQLLEPGDIGIYILRGAALSKMDSTEAAQREYKKALDLDPENPDVHFLIGKSLFEAQSFDSSLSYFENAIKYYELIYNRKTLIMFQNLQEVDTELVQKIVVLWSEQEMDELASLLRKELGFDEGLDVHEQTVEQFYKAATDLARAFYFAGMTYYNLKNDSLALVYLVKNLDLNPGEADALYYAGELYIRLEEYQNALVYLEKLTQLKPDDLLAWFYLGVCYTQLKEYEKAIDVYENRVLELDPDNIDAMNNLAYVYSEIGNTEKSLEYLMRVRELQE